jgi:flagellin-like protein
MGQPGRAASAESTARAQVGIGTLIIFIAMVLVAAITAGVFFDTANLLESESAQTGEESRQQVTDRLVTVAVTGDHITADGVGVVNLTVKKSASAGRIDVRETTVTWVGPSGAYNVVHAESGGSTTAAFGTTAFNDADGSAPVLTDETDRIQLTFDLGTDDTAVDGAGAFGQRLAAGETVRLTMTTGAGTSTTERLRVPPSLDGRSSVSL